MAACVESMDKVTCTIDVRTEGGAVVTESMPIALYVDEATEESVKCHILDETTSGVGMASDVIIVCTVTSLGV